jgi:hypothetical protein
MRREQPQWGVRPIGRPEGLEPHLENLNGVRSRDLAGKHGQQTCLLCLLAKMKLGPPKILYIQGFPPAFPLLFSFLFILTLLTSSRSRMAFDGSTRPPLHSGASRTVEYPSGSSSAEFLIAFTGLPVPHFSLRSRLRVRP